MKKNILLPILAILFVLKSCDHSQAQNSKLNAADFSAKIKEVQGATIIDVRTQEEYAGGHLPNAQNIDWNQSDFDQRVAHLDKSKPIFIYCLSGGRSSSAAEKMRANGFQEVYEMRGGLLKWRAAKLPLSTDNKLTKASGITRSEYDKIIKSDKFVLVDFYADWCGPCKKMKPYLDEIADEMKATVQVIRINADENPILCQDLSIEALPTLFVYKKGTMMWYNAGYVEKTTIQQYLR